MFDFSMFDLFSAKVFCICHSEDIDHFYNFSKHLQSSGDNKILFESISNYTINPGENIDSAIINEIANSHFVIYFVSVDAQADLHSLFYIYSAIPSCQYFKILVRPVNLMNSLDHAELFRENPLNSIDDEDKFWTELVNELKYWIYHDKGIEKYNNGQFEEAKPLFNKAKELIGFFYYDRIQLITEYITSCEKSIFENETYNRIYSELNNEFGAKYLPQERLTEQLQLSSDQLTTFKKITVGLILGVVLLMGSTISFCNRSNDKIISIGDEVPAYPSQLIIDSFYVKNITKNGNSEAYDKDNIPYDQVGLLQPSVIMRTVSKKTRKFQFYWRLIQENNEIVKLKSGSPQNFTAKIELTVDANRNVYPLGKGIGANNPSFERGVYKNELWVLNNSELILVFVDYFKIK